MTYGSIIKGLDEAIKLNKNELKGRRQKIKVSPVQAFSHNEIKGVRLSLELTQNVFAQILGVSIKTVEAWEKGTNIPNGPARRVIGMLKDDPNLIETLYLSSIPENKESVIEGLEMALENCVSEDEIVW